LTSIDFDKIIASFSVEGRKGNVDEIGGNEPGTELVVFIVKWAIRDGAC
jgi:hypothetical protein